MARFHTLVPHWDLDVFSEHTASPASLDLAKALIYVSQASRTRDPAHTLPNILLWGFTWHRTEDSLASRLQVKQSSIAGEDGWPGTGAGQ